MIHVETSPGWLRQVSAIIGALPETHILGTCWGLLMMRRGVTPRSGLVGGAGGVSMGRVVVNGGIMTISDA